MVVKFYIFADDPHTHRYVYTYIYIYICTCRDILHAQSCTMLICFPSIHIPEATMSLLRSEITQVTAATVDVPIKVFGCNLLPFMDSISIRARLCLTSQLCRLVPSRLAFLQELHYADRGVFPGSECGRTQHVGMACPLSSTFHGLE